MRSLLLLALILTAISCFGQTIFQKGEVLDEIPVLSFVYSDSTSSTGYSEHFTFLTADNYNGIGTTIGIGIQSANAENDSIIELDLFNIPGHTRTQPYLKVSTIVNQMVFGAGLSGRTVSPVHPALICAPLYAPVYNDTGSTIGIEVSWRFEVTDISYEQFNPKYVGFVIENKEDLLHPQPPFGSSIVPSFIGAFNSPENQAPKLTISRIWPELSGSYEELMEIPLDNPFYINSVKEFDGQLLISGFEMNAETELRKFAQVYLVDLESGEWERIDIGFGSEHTEVVASLIMENGSVVSLIEETDILGTWLQSKLVIDGVDLITFNSAFHPTKIVGEHWGQIRVGGEYDFQGVSKASVIDINPSNGEMIMKGYADIPGGSSEFRYFHRSEYGKYIAGYFNGASESSSFLTRMVAGNLLSVQSVEKNQLATIRGTTLVFNQGGIHQYTVIDASGRLIQSDETTNRTVALNLPTGFYNVVVTNESDIQSLKVAIAN